MPQSKRNRLMPWNIGLVIIAVAVGFAIWQVQSGGCAAPPATLVIALVVMPLVYVVLMYLTLTSQD